MANSKFSGVGFASGQNPTNSSVFAGYETIGAGQYENRRWTTTELFSTQVTGADGIKFIFTSNQQCRFNHNGFDATGSGSVAATQNIVINADTDGTGQNLSFRINGSERMDITNANTTHNNAVKFIGGIKDGGNSLGSSGQVLSSTGSGLQWINAGGSTPDIQTVVNAGANSVINDQGGNRSYIDFREGNTTAQFNVGKDPGGTFGIKVGQGNFALQGAVFQSIYLQPGVNSQRRLALIDTTSGNALTELTGSMDMKFSSTSALKCGGTASPGTSGQVLKSTGTSIEWVSAENLDFSGLPTSDPGQAGKLWNDEGTIKISIP